MKKQIKFILLKILRYSGIPWLLRTFIQINNLTAIYYHDVDPLSFEKHVKYIVQHYNVISIDDLHNYLYKNKPSIPKRALLITFDDGHTNNYQLLSICQKYKVQPTIFLTTNMIGNLMPFWFKLHFTSQTEKKSLKNMPDDERIKHIENNYADELRNKVKQSLSWEEVYEMSSTFNFHSHTQNHPCLPMCSEDVIFSELKISKFTIEQKLKTNCYALAFPNGDYNQRILDLCKQIGYQICFTGKPGFITRNSNPFELCRFSMNDTNNFDDFIVRLTGLWFIVKRLARKIK